VMYRMSSWPTLRNYPGLCWRGTAESRTLHIEARHITDSEKWRLLSVSYHEQY